MREHIVINSDRSVTVPDSLKKIGIQYDHNVNTLTFDCPRYADDAQSIDMSKMQIFINWMLPDKSIGCSIAENIIIDEADSTLMHFDWIITSAVTPVFGILERTLVCIKQTDTDGREIYHWNTDLFQKFSVGEGMECNEQLAEENMDVITQLLVKMDAVDTRTSTEAMRSYVSEYMTENPPQPSDEQANAGVDAYMTENGQDYVNTYMGENAQSAVNTYMDVNAQSKVNTYMEENAQEHMDTYMEQNAQNKVDDYLERNPLQLDNTLTDPTKAAPADKVGEIGTEVDELKGDLVNLTNGVCNIKFDYKYEAIQGEQEPYVFKFYGNSGETYKFENKGIRVNIILVYTDNTRKTVSNVTTGTVSEITLEKDCKSFGFYPYESGQVFISVYGDSYKKIMSDVSDMLHEPKNRIAENTDNIEKMLKTYGIKPTIKKSEIFVDSNYKLIDGGVCIYDAKYELREYAVEENQLIFVKSDERYQFQNDKNVPTSDNAHLVGEQFVGDVNGVIRVPQGATYVIVSSIKTGENGIYDFEPIEVNFSESKYYKKDVFISVNDKKWFDGLDLTYNDFNESTTVEQYFTKMNELADSFSWRITKENLGKDASGKYDIWGYAYSPFDMPEASQTP